MQKLLKGIINFRHNHIEQYREKFAKLALGQSPDVLFIACCDSRVVPNAFASTDPGDLFVLRNIGNLVPPYITCSESSIPSMDISVPATLEFSIRCLMVSHIIICGHSNCAAMQFFINNDPRINNPFLDAWLKYALPSYNKFQKEFSDDCDGLTPCNKLSQVNVLQQLEHLKTYPLIAKRLLNNEIKIHGWWFDLSSADIYHSEPSSGAFNIIDEETVNKMISSFTQVKSSAI